MHTSLEDMPLETQIGEIEIHAAQWDEIYVRHVDLPAGTDFTPLFVGLPGDLCQCEHWGHIIRGSITVRYADGREEINKAGELYYWPGGHTGWTDEGVEFVEFNRTSDIMPVLAHLSKQLA